ncbi:MAG: hypothetical protein HYX94_12730 [Chloroflexi bacterium]|nr:hypothetical protein [Chloroflexota bacterium]
MNYQDERGSNPDFSRNWLALFLTLLLLGAAAFLLQVLAGARVASATTIVGLVVLSAFALVDGGWRLFGKGGFLGPGEGLDRLLAAVQIVLAIGVLARLIG